MEIIRYVNKEELAAFLAELNNESREEKNIDFLLQQFNFFAPHGSRAIESWYEDNVLFIKCRFESVQAFHRFKFKERINTKYAW